MQMISGSLTPGKRISAPASWRKDVDRSSRFDELPGFSRERKGRGHMAGRALIAIDVQIDFCPGGALAVAGGDEIVAEINALAPRFEHLIITQDWHPASHSSFATSHPGKQPFE